MKRIHRLICLVCLVVLKMDVTETGFENVRYTQLFQDANHCLVLLNSKMKLVQLWKESLDQLNIVFCEIFLHHEIGEFSLFT